MAVSISLLALSVTVLTLVDGVWLQMLNAAFLAFIIVQISYTGHDLCHNQVFRSSRNNDILGLFVSLLIGINRSWWVEKHNKHHSNPNDLDMDPDIEIPVVAFSEDQARGKTGVARLIVRYQAFLFYVLLCFEGFVLKFSGIRYIVTNRLKFPIAEPTMMVGYIGVYTGLVFLSLPVWQGVVVHRSQSVANRAVHWLDVRPQPQGHADAEREAAARLLKKAGAYIQECEVESPE